MEVRARHTRDNPFFARHAAIAYFGPHTVISGSDRPPSLLDLQLLLENWQNDLSTEGLTYHGVDVLDLLDIEINLALRERWFGAMIPRARTRAAGFVRASLARSAPSLLFRLERARVTGGSLPQGSRRTSGARVLVIAQGATASDLGTLLPVIQEIERRGVVVTIATADPAVAKKLSKTNREFYNLLIPSGSVVGYSRIARRLLRAMMSAARRGSAPLCQMRRFGVFELVIRRAMVALQALDNLVPMLERIDVVVVASDVHLIGKAAVLVANARGKRTVVVQNGMYGEGHNAVTLGFLPVAAQLVCTWSEASAALLRSHGVPGHRIRITGQPRFDVLPAIDPVVSRQQLARIVFLPEGARVVTFASQNIFRRLEHVEPLVRAFHAITEALTDVVVVVKLHPSESPHLWRAAVGGGNGGGRIVVTKDIGIHAVLSASDVVVTAFSTAGLEALALRRPLIVLTDLERAGEMKYVDLAAALPATVDTLAKTVRLVLTDPIVRDRLAAAAERFVKQYAGPVDGRSAERVADEALTVVAGQHRTE